MPLIPVDAHVRAIVNGRVGTLKVSDAADPVLTYKVAFLDPHILPHSDWYKANEVEEIREGDAIKDVDWANRIRNVITGVQANRDDIVKLLDANNIATPEKYADTPPLPKGGRPLVVVTDQEPDDILSIMMMRQRRPGPLPIVIHVADLQWKDRGGILAKKIVLSACALGRTYAARLIVFDGTEKDQQAMEKAQTQFKEMMQASEGVDPEWMFIAPGRGRLTQLMSGFGQAPCHVYSGSFNTRLPQMSKEDIEAIRRVAKPINDSAAFIFTKNFSGLQSLNNLWPELGEDIKRWNASYAEAWRQFAQEFDAMLINPGHPGLFFKPRDKPDEDPLTPEERQHFTDVVTPLFGDPTAPGAETWKYAKALVDASYFNKMTGFKKPTALALASGKRDGPLCDMLCPISDWLRNEGSKLQEVEVKVGLWSLNHEKGFTKILPPDAPMADPPTPAPAAGGAAAQEGKRGSNSLPPAASGAVNDAPAEELGLCEGTMVALLNPETDTVHIKAELVRVVEEMTTIR